MELPTVVAVIVILVGVGALGMIFQSFWDWFVTLFFGYPRSYDEFALCLYHGFKGMWLDSDGKSPELMDKADAINRLKAYYLEGVKKGLKEFFASKKFEEMATAPSPFRKSNKRQ